MATKKQEEMQAEIIRCSKNLFEIYGYANTSIRMISKEMGFKNQASFYIYFESKDKMAALILQKNAHIVRQYIKNLNLKDTGSVQLLLLENLIITEMLRDEFNRKFYTEAQGAQNFSNMVDQIPGYTQNLYENIITEITDLTFDELQLNLFAYIKGVCGVFQAIDSKESQVSFDNATKRLPYVFLELMGVDYHRQEKIIEETRKIFSNIPEEDLKNLYFFAKC
ncbi:TetR/AcrR family transcriptional regulator [Acetobacterium woodii]|uniref:Transcriptional regulator TetR family n=1 Tax=Acetobacterium woodii (strain ATCC 29683 / DSM 1030 / JCM 2381 / KCTC 1655 / WB1) TaxID=931626 RepID=H6LGF6_ACEWD|nr:TetR/AcrR family transcriptional regulator [Acetobacterium woodii]AFA47092.1 transcriptional regulator TetR family [Acetobacterium woodii DSM 1030]